jgi:hypothetical protein
MHDQFDSNCSFHRPSQCSLSAANKAAPTTTGLSASYEWGRLIMDFLFATIPVLINVLLYLTNFLGKRLKRILVVGVLRLQV